MGGEGGGSEREEGEAFSVSLSPARCRLQNESSCFPLSLRGSCCFFFSFSFSFFSFSFLSCARNQKESLQICFPLLTDLCHTPRFIIVIIIFCLGSTMPVVGVASKLRQPSAVGTKPVHTALPIPSAVRAATSQGYMARQQDLRAGEGAPGLSCQLSIKSEYQPERRPEGKSRAETEESKICKVSGGGHSLSLYLCSDTPQLSPRTNSVTVFLSVSVMLALLISV